MFLPSSNKKPMDTEKILKELNSRFAVPLPDYYKRRIVFWKDPNREFAEDVESGAFANLSDAEFITLTSHNAFFAKKRVCFDEKLKNFLIYVPEKFAEEEDNWLLNVELYSESFCADKVSIWLNEMDMQATPDLPQKREVIERHRSFFKSAERRKKVREFAGGVDKKIAHLRLAMLSVASGAKVSDLKTVIRAVLACGVESAEENKAFAAFKKFGIVDFFKEFLLRYTGFVWGDGQDNALQNLICHLALSASVDEFGGSVLSGLEEHICQNPQNAAFCRELLSEWLHTDSASFAKCMEAAERKLQIIVRFEKSAPSDIADSTFFPCVDDAIISHTLSELESGVFDILKIRSIMDIRKGKFWWGKCAVLYSAISTYLDMLEFRRARESGFHLTNPADICQAYAKDYYKMDILYRKFCVVYAECENSERFESLGDKLKSVLRDKAQALYTNWFLAELSANWTTACENALKASGRIDNILQQENFYEEFVRSDKRTFVIISDAFRYELAVQLREELLQAHTAKAVLKPMQAIFPTETKFGMAALLPHKELSVERTPDGLKVLTDGKSTESGNREVILKAANPQSIAVKAESLLGMVRRDAVDLVRGQEVIYIYHNVVDKSGHSETDVFAACENAIEQIKRIVRKIKNELSGVRIVITADHGFLYTQSELAESDKVAKSIPKTETVESSDRYIIAKKSAADNMLMSVKFTPALDEFNAFTPRENIRINRRGGAPKFIHGGASLQEIIIPVLEFNIVREASATFKSNREKYDSRPVEIRLIADDKRTSNRIFALKFYQTDAVGENRSAAKYRLYFTDESGALISDIQTVIADKKDSDANARTFTRTFNLKSGQYNSRNAYFLVIEDENKIVPPAKEPFVIDIAFTDDGFDL